MATITTEAIKQLREQTGAGVMDCRRALEQSDGDVAKAVKFLHEKGLERAESKAGRVARQGVIDSYLHAGGRIGALVELNCETDFVARDEGFRALAHELAMQIAASPETEFVRDEDAPTDLSEDEKKQKVLMMQSYIKNPSQTIGELIIERAARFGENVRVRRFVRFELGA